MAWNGRVVKTYGRHKQRMIKNEAWISPELKPATGTNVFSSPDTDISAMSADGSIDASSTMNGRPAKHQGKSTGCKIVTMSPLVTGTNKENVAVVTLAPETPEEEQGRRRRGGLRNARKITRNTKQLESTPKLFSSDSDDGLRKAVGRKALTLRTNTMASKTKPTKYQPAKSKASAHPSRVKNIIKNDSYTIIRSPPPRCQRSSKRFKTGRATLLLSADPNLSMSPFQILESWIDVVAATSTPMAELVKLDNNDKRIKDNSLLEESLSNGDQELQLSTPETCGPDCKCKSCEEANRVAGKLFELTLSEQEDNAEVNGESTAWPESSGSSRGLSSSMHSDSEDARSGHEAMLRNSTEDGSESTRSGQEANLSNCSVSLEPLSKELKHLHIKPDVCEKKESRHDRLKTRNQSQDKLKSNRRRLRSRGDSTGDESESARLGQEVNLSNCSVSLEPLSRELKSLHLKSDVCEKKESRRDRLRTRGQSQEEEEEIVEKRVSNSRRIRTRGQSLNEDRDSDVALSSTRIRTRGQSRSETDKTEDEEEELPVRKLRTRGQSGSQTSKEGDQENDEKEGSVSRRLQTRAQSREEDESEQEQEVSDDEEAESVLETNRRRLHSRRLSEQSEDRNESGDENEEPRMRKIRQTVEKEVEEEPMCPVTPRKNHLASFHTDSFKEVFTPKKHKDTGLPITGREKVLQQCEQSEPIPFTECMSPAMLKKCVKIGEGVYGEVFRTTNSKRQSVAIKIIPIEGDFEVNEEPQKMFDEMLPEIVISGQLSFLCEGEMNFCNSFIGVNNVSCVQGCYPDSLLKEWDKFDDRKGSENDRPDIFDEEQLYIVFEFADGGSDLEGFEFKTLQQAVSILQQVACALAVAERELEFEHRDLHWGNVLIRSTRRNHVNFRLGDEDYSVESHGLVAGIIDFTLSRLQKDECTIFCDLAADPTLFDGTGDYQFQVYRKMKKENDNNWEPFMPHTNVLWLHYLTDKLINNKTYQNSSSKAHKSALAKLRSFYRSLLRHDSAEEVVTETDLFDL